MTKAIITKRGPTGTYTASDGDGNRAGARFAPELNTEQRHRAAALALCHKMGWTGELLGAHILTNRKTTAMVWIWNDHRLFRIDVNPPKE